jgi:hypothetical protein
MILASFLLGDLGNGYWNQLWRPSMNASSDLTMEAYAELVIAKLRAKGVSDAIYETSTESVLYHRPESGPAGIRLTNGFNNARNQSHEEVLRTIETTIADMETMPGDRDGGIETIKDALMPVVRDNRHFSMSHLMVMNSGIKPDAGMKVPLRKIAGEMVLAIFLDSERQMQQATNAHLEGWGVDFDQAMQIATRNLVARSQKSFRKLGEGVYISDWQDDFDLSRILLTETILGLPIKGNPVAALPTRNHLIIAGSKDDFALGALINIASDLIEADSRPVSALLLEYRDGKWNVFDTNLPAMSRLKKSAFEMLYGNYGQQKSLLEAIFEKQKKDIFSATMRAFDEGDAKELKSLSQWTKNVTTLLPRTDRLAFLDLDTKEMVIAHWVDADRIVGERMKPQGLHPERYMVTGYPTDDQLAELRKCAISILNT